MFSHAEIVSTYIPIQHVYKLKFHEGLGLVYKLCKVVLKSIQETQIQQKELDICCQKIGCVIYKCLNENS